MGTHTWRNAQLCLALGLVFFVGCGDDGGNTADAGFSCPPGLVDCGGTCVDPNTDESFCGAGSDCTTNPGTTCAAGEVCNSGTCELTCQSGLIDCNGTCVDPNTDEAYCGAGPDCSTNPGTACAPGELCNGSGSCELSCQTGLVDCNGTCIDPNTSQTYCGAGADCSTNPGTTCAPGELCNG